MCGSEEPVVDQDFAGDLFHPRGLDLLRQIFERRERVGVRQLGVVVAAVGITVVVIFEGEFAILRGASSEGEVAAGHEDEVAFQHPGFADFPAGVHGRDELVIGAEGDERRGAGIEFRHRRGDDQLLGIAFVHDLPGLGIEDANAPAGLLVILAVDHRFDRLRQWFVGAGMNGCQCRGNEEQSQRTHR